MDSSDGSLVENEALMFNPDKMQPVEFLEFEEPPKAVTFLPPRVRVACDGVFTRVLGLSGESIESTEVKFAHIGDGVPLVTIALLAVPFDAEGIVARYELFDPETRTKKVIRRIVFDDDSEWRAPGDLMEPPQLVPLIEEDLA